MSTTASDKYNELRLDTIQSQYSTSPHILELTNGFALRIDPSPDIDLFYEKIFDIDTAEGWGLDNWGRILAISRKMTVQQLEGWYGFYGSLLKPMNEGIFWSYDAATGIVSINDDVYRQLLKYKAASNIGSASARALNEVLANIFDGKTVYCREIGTMQIQITCEFILEAYELAILRTYGMLNKGAGVSVAIQEVDASNTFGFANTGLQPFGYGKFGIDYVPITDD